MAKDKRKSNSTAVMIQRLVMLLFFLFGLALLVYPFISQGINDYLDQRTVQRYQKEASKKNKAEIEKLRNRMANPSHSNAEAKKRSKKTHLLMLRNIRLARSLSRKLM